MAPPVRDALALYAAFWAGLFLLAGAEDKDVGKNDTHHHYNCDTLNPEGWTESRIDWCCLYEHKACRFDCEAALNGWEDSWSLLKKEWCCKNKQVGCSKLGLESTAAPTGLATPAPLTSTVLTTVARTSAPEPTTTVPVTVETTTPVVATVAPTTAESTTSVPVTTTAPAATVAPITVASTTALPLTTAAPAATDESLATTVPAVSAAPGSAVLSESCFEEKIAWDPLDMPGTFPTPVKNAAACQALCANTTGCVHFTFWWIGKSCHLQDAYVVRQTGRLGFVSGPFRCWDDVDQTDYVRKGPNNIVSKDYRCVELAVLYSPIMGLMKHFPKKEDGDAIQAVKDCRAYCAAQEGCAHFTMVFPQRTCRMANAKARRLANYQGAVSGTPTCYGGVEHAEAIEQVALDVNDDALRAEFNAVPRAVGWQGGSSVLLLFAVPAAVLGVLAVAKRTGTVCTHSHAGLTAAE